MGAGVFHRRHNLRISCGCFAADGEHYDTKKSNSGGDSETLLSAVDILAYSTECGLTAADFERLSIGFVIDLCAAKVRLKSGEADLEEEKYMKMKRNVGLVQKKYERGEVSDERYQDFMKKYKELEERYGFNN